MDSPINNDRDFEVTQDLAVEITSKLATTEWRLFVLGRIGGMRPCEIVTLKWTDILWDMLWDEKRTGSTHPRLIFDTALYGRTSERRSTTHLASRRRTLCTHQGGLATKFTRQLDKIGVESWPKPFHNMRASRRDELEKRYRPFREQVVRSF